MTQTHAIIGGGAAGFFAALACAAANPAAKVILLEKMRQPLAKVRISGGGRCNVTHYCFDPALLVKSYPRGQAELRGPFSRFQPKDTVEWYESRGVKLKAEEDGRMFPTTDNSQTIIDCLMSEVTKLGVELRTECGVKEIRRLESGFQLQLAHDETLDCHTLLLATGGNRPGYDLARSLGHTIVDAVPSLFTFNIPDSPLLELSGVSVNPVDVEIVGTKLQQTGPLLITHWGFSGPAVLKLSAWGARILHDVEYRSAVAIRWLSGLTEAQIRDFLLKAKGERASRNVLTDGPFEIIPRKLWSKLASLCGILPEQRWATLSKAHLNVLVQRLYRDVYTINGKTTYKQEFVTSGGVSLKEINFTTMESRVCPNLFFAGELLDIDGITGGFNFQAAWTTGWIAGNTMSTRV